MSAEVIGGDGRIKDRQGVPPQGVVFRAVKTADVGLGTGWNGPISFDSKVFDPYIFFDGSKFQPKIAGYYRLSANLVFSGGTSGAQLEVALARNGSVATISTTQQVTALPAFRSDGWGGANVTDIMYFNGTTDYAEVYNWLSAGATLRGTAGERTSVSAELIGATVGVIPGPWVPLPMTANWTGTSGPDPAPQYRKQLDGLIVMRGLAVLTGAGYTAVMGTLPAGQGLRPAKPERFVVPTFAAGGAGSWGAAYISVNIDGTISHNVQFAGTTPGAAGSWVSLAGVNFPGES